MILWTYIFDDGTKLQSFNDGISTTEMWKLVKLHGGCNVSYEQI